MTLLKSETKDMFEKIKEKEVFYKIGNEYWLRERYARSFELEYDMEIDDECYEPPFSEREIWKAYESIYQRRIERIGVAKLKKANIVTRVGKTDSMTFDFTYTTFMNTSPYDINEYTDLTPSVIFNEVGISFDEGDDKFEEAIKKAETLGFILRHPTEPKKFKVNPKYILLMEDNYPVLLLLPNAKLSAAYKYLQPFTCGLKIPLVL